MCVIISCSLVHPRENDSGQPGAVGRDDPTTTAQASESILCINDETREYEH